MYIKTIRVKGLLSYRDEVQVDLAKGMNVIVGPNGSGKSSFITAILLAVTDEYRKRKPDKRQELHFNGIGAGQLSPPYVEIVFDNTDRRLPVENDTVTFRRQFGLKKDRILINGKETADARLYLQSAGFTNPYFIVKQGQIMSIAMSTDSQRLQLFKDIAGLSLMDLNLRKSAVKAEEAAVLREEIDSRVKTLNDRIAELEAERSALEKATALDADKRAIEYILSREDIERLTRKQAEFELRLNIAREQWRQSKLEKKDQATTIQTSKEEDIQKINKYESRLTVCVSKIHTAQAQIEDSSRQLRDEELKLKECQDEIISLEANADQRDSRLEVLRSEIKVNQALLNRLRKKYYDCLHLENEKKAKWAAADVKLKQLTEKMEHSSQFTSVEARNCWIDEKIVELSGEKAKLRGALDYTTHRISEIEGSIRNKEQEIHGHHTEQEQIQSDSLTIRRNKIQVEQSLKTKESLLADTRNKVFECKEVLNAERENQSKFKNALMKSAGRAVVSVMEVLENICAELSPEEGGESLYFGTVLDCFTCDESVQLAIEAAAGKKLFHHVVKDHAFAMKIMKEFNKRKHAGDVDFIPLDRIYSQVVNFQPTPSVCSLLDQIAPANDRVLPALKHVFGRTLLCQDLEVASQTAKERKITCVTTEGDKVKGGGAMSGGYVNPATSKIRAFKSWVSCGKKISDINKKIQATEVEETELQKEIRQLVTGRDKLACQYDRMRSLMEENLKKGRVANNYIEEQKLVLEKVTRYAANLQEKVEGLDMKMEALRQELDEDLELPTEEDLRNMQELRAEVKHEGQELMAFVKRRAKLEAELKKVELKINQELKPLEAELSAFNFSDPSEKKREEEKLIESCNNLRQELEAKQEKMEKLLQAEGQFNRKLTKLKAKLEEETEKLKQLEQEMASEHPAVLEAMDQLNFLKEKLNGKTYDGVLPANISKFENCTRTYLMKKLKKINSELKDSHVDVSKVNAFSQLNEVNDEVREKIRELDAAKESLARLRNVLEERKQGILVQFFSTLQRHFGSIFRTLVPAGHAKLVLYGDDFELSAEQEGEPLPRIDDERVKGVGIRVSFHNADGPEQSQTVQQLSGGQKSIIAVALILAMQKVHPVPIYLLDEIDQALDPSYRENVAQYIKSVAEETQFICTTFRREFVEEADRHFGVLNANTVSNVKQISMDLAVNFVHGVSSSASATATSGTETDDATLSDLTLPVGGAYRT